MEGTARCSICNKMVPQGDMQDRLGLSFCPECIDDLGIDGLEISEPDPDLFSIMEEKGRNILPTVTAMLRSRTAGEGWKLLALAPFISDQVEDPSRKVLMECSMMLMGCSMIRLGRKGEDTLSEKDATLFLVLGQYLDLSILGRIALDRDLREEDPVHGLILDEAHDHLIFRLLEGLDHGDDPEKKSTVVRAMRLLRD